MAAGKDNMGGSAASRLTNSGVANPGVDGSALGTAGGADRDTLTTAQMPAHKHMLDNGDVLPMTYTSGGSPRNTLGQDTDIAGGGAAHPIVQPTLVLNQIIYAGI